jgi:cytochrome c oxidase subunit 2
MHSLFIPVFRTKQDALPDRYTTMWFEADRPGTYHLLCAEYCGTEHSQMRGEVVVMEPAAYQRWLADAAEPAPGEPGTPEGPLAIGRDHPFFRYGCNACHLPTSAVRAPRLDGIFGQEIRLASGRSVIADEQYIRESILEPQAKISAGYPEPSLMPTYQGQLAEEDLAELVEFIRALAEGWPEEVLP